MDIREEILDYINRKDFSGALLLTGQWGCGKSYLMKELAKEMNNKKKAAITVISLFGIDSVEAINKRVKEEYIEFMLGNFGKKARKLSRAVTSVVKDGMNIASIASSGNPGLSAASHGLSAVLNYDVFGLYNVQNTVGKDENQRQFILVFDDLERCNLTKKDLLGAINEYVENKRIKTIIIADEDKISGSDYNEYKEKLISRTIRMINDSNYLVEQIVRGFKETANGYQQFLLDNKAILIQVFNESRSNNYRTLNAILADFERIYEAWNETGISRENMKWALYTFASEVYISKTHQKEETPRNQKDISFFSEKKEEQYTNKGKNKSSFVSFGKWIGSGIWDKDKFVNELKGKYIETIETPLEHFLYSFFWGLQQRDIDEGLPAAVNLAYEGELNSDEYIYLMQKVYYLRSSLIDLPCEIDYVKMESGFKKRMKAIRDGIITEPQRRTFSEKQQLDPEAYQLYGLIERLDDKIDAWKNRSRLITYLQGDSTVSRYSIKGLYLEELDEELLSVFEKCYTVADNSDKRDYATLLLSMTYDFETYSSKDNIVATRNNFENLKEWLSLMVTNDSITALINRSFIEEIRKMAIMSEK